MGLLAALALLFLPGCAPRYIQGSPGEVEKSMAACADVRINGKSVPQFMTGRTAFVLDVEQAKLTGTSQNVGEIELKEKTAIEFGTATAIDPRGYFLTAAHCLEKRAPYLGYSTGGKVHFEKCRVVWRSPRGQPDLALLHVAFPLKSTFTWSPNVPGGSDVLASGYTFGKKQTVRMRFVTGKIRLIREEPEATPAFSVISHTAPLFFGNSGGPLFDREGRLLGINVTADGELEWWKYAVTIHGGTALRPDLAWLKKKIAEDQAQQHSR